MPNWVDNKLTIRGPEVDVQRFLESVKGQVNGEELILDFNKIVPEPEVITLDMITDPKILCVMSGYDGCADLWYWWRWQHWGTKGVPNPDSAEIQEDLGYEAKLVFDTAWEAPIPIVLAASRLFPTLWFELRYFEPMNCFQGIYVCMDGHVQMQAVGEYDEYDEDDQGDEDDDVLEGSTEAEAKSGNEGGKESLNNDTLKAAP
jgi:hypothetical protein